VNLDRNHWDFLCCFCLFPILIIVFFEVSENIVEDKVTVGLFGEEEGLGEFSPSLVSIRHFSRSENNNTSSG
jgi:hypothetical protein